MRWFIGIMVAAAAAVIGLASVAANEGPKSQYEVGQVWSYKTRPQDVGSLLKIQAIEPFGGEGEKVYHVSLIGLHIGGKHAQNELPHTPVSEATLNKSVIALQSGDYQFPSPQEGMEIWRNDNGGIFDVTIAEIVDFIDQTVSKSS